MPNTFELLDQAYIAALLLHERRAGRHREDYGQELSREGTSLRRRPKLDDKRQVAGGSVLELASRVARSKPVIVDTATGQYVLDISDTQINDLTSRIYAWALATMQRGRRMPWPHAAATLADMRQRMPYESFIREDLG